VQVGLPQSARDLPARSFRLGVPEHRYFPHETWRRLSARALREWSRAGFAYAPSVGIPALRALFEYDFNEPLKDLSVPIVAIDSDLGEPVNEARIRKVLPKFHATVIPGTGHFLMMEDPARFNPALETEIQAILAPEG